MNRGPLIKIQAATAAEICVSFKLKKEAKELLRDDMNPQQFLAALLENKKYLDAIDFMAHALPAREGIWWGCLCMQHALGDNLSPPDRAAATAAVRWLMQPSEENRVAAQAPGAAAGPASAAGALAMAANQAGPKSAKGIAMSVKIASTKFEPLKMAGTQRSFLDLGLEVAEGRYI